MEYYITYIYIYIHLLHVYIYIYIYIYIKWIVITIKCADIGSLTNTKCLDARQSFLRLDFRHNSCVWFGARFLLNINEFSVQKYRTCEFRGIMVWHYTASEIIKLCASFSPAYALLAVTMRACYHTDKWQGVAAGKQGETKKIGHSDSAGDPSQGGSCPLPHTIKS